VLVIRLLTLGAPACFVDDVDLVELPVQKTRFALLVYLAIERNVSRDDAATMFWGDSSEERARHALSQAIYELKRLLGDKWLDTQSGRLVVTDELTADAHQLAQFCAARDFDRAADVYRGPFLAGFFLTNCKDFSTWVDKQRAQLERLHRQARRECVNALVQSNRLPIAIATARRWVELDPLEDEANHKLIELLASAGDRSEALRQFAEYEQRLREELEVEPLDHTKALVQSLATGSHSRQTPSESHPITNIPVESSGLSISRARAGAVILAAAIVLGVAIPFIGAWRRDDSAFSLESKLHPDRVAVLPFDISPDVNGRDFRQRLMDELTRSPQIEVAPRQDVDRAAGAPDNTVVGVAQATKSLVAVTGSLTTDGAELKLTIRTWDGVTGAQLGSKAFSTPKTAGASALVQDVADYLTDDVAASLDMLAYRRDATKEPAWEMFNRAIQQNRSSRAFANTAQFDAALRAAAVADSLLTITEKMDPNWVAPTLMRARVALLVASIVRIPIAGRTPSEVQQWFISAVAQTGRALERKPGSAEALEMRGKARYEFWSWRAGEQSVNDVPLRRDAERDLLDAIAADSRRARAWLTLASIAGAVGDFNKQKMLAAKALEVDPTSSRDMNLFVQLGTSSLELGDETEALRWCLAGQRRFPGHMPLIHCEAAVRGFGTKLPPDVARMWQIAHEIDKPGQPPQMASQVAMFEMLAAAAIAHAGLADSARAVATRASAKAPGYISLMLPEAVVWMRLGDYGRALTLLEANAAIDPIWMPPQLKGEAFAPLRNEPRFKQLVARYVKT
jgi:DNA-binding SARP family transcriptional activator